MTLELTTVVLKLNGRGSMQSFQAVVDVHRRESMGLKRLRINMRQFDRSNGSNLTISVTFFETWRVQKIKTGEARALWISLEKFSFPVT